MLIGCRAMTDIPFEPSPGHAALTSAKFSDPEVTAKGEPRASVALNRLDTLWINTGTLCNIECINCYIESSPTNDRLAYFSAQDAARLFDEIHALGLGTREIGFTGGEPFMNPDIIAMLEDALTRGFDVLILTNAMQPMQRPRLRTALLDLRERFGGRLWVRVSLDHYSESLHDTERGPGAWAMAIRGMDWLSENRFRIAVAGRTCWNETEDQSRAGYARMFAERGYRIDPNHPMELVLFPEMDGSLEVPEITTACWGILGIDPAGIMCATSRMVVKRKGESEPAVMPCTLLPYQDSFRMGGTLREALCADTGNFENGKVKLNHPHCSKFCVLGGGSCSARD